MGVQRRGRRPGRRGARAAGGLRRRARGRRDAGRLRRRRPRAHAVGGRRDRRARTARRCSAGSGPWVAAWMRPPSVRVRAGSRELAAERRALDRLGPGAQLASTRERVGLLLDRATRAINDRIVVERAGGRPARSAARLDPAGPAGARSRAARAVRAHRRPGRPPRRPGAAPSLDSAVAALQVLGPQATLERGYAIVRRAPDERIVRDPAEAPPGTRLTVRVARGERRRPRSIRVPDLVDRSWSLGRGRRGRSAIRVGMLVAPRLDRLTEPRDEDDGGDHRLTPRSTP